MLNLTLPQYPVTSDLWDILKNEKRPIVIYGMGNGADKLIARFDALGIKFADIFASDGFVRGHSFHGIRVKSFSEIKENYKDFIIVLSFASSRPEVLEMLSEINKSYVMLVPDMPVAGEEYFDKSFYNEHYPSILKAYEALSDDESRKTFAAVVRYKLTGEVSYLFEVYQTTDDIYRLIGKDAGICIDAGAYNGDTVREAIGYFDNLRKIYAFEPDARNYKKLMRYVEQKDNDVDIACYNCAVWSADSEGVFVGSGNRNSSISSTASYKNREESVALARLDSIVKDKVDYIKYDVEGAEFEAIVGSSKLIENQYPTLLISAYHRSCDLFYLVNTVNEMYPEYKLYMRRTLCVPAWEIAIIAKK